LKPLNALDRNASALAKHGKRLAIVSVQIKKEDTKEEYG